MDKFNVDQQVKGGRARYCKDCRKNKRLIKKMEEIKNKDIIPEDVIREALKKTGLSLDIIETALPSALAKLRDEIFPPTNVIKFNLLFLEFPSSLKGVVQKWLMDVCPDDGYKPDLYKIEKISKHEVQITFDRKFKKEEIDKFEAMAFRKIDIEI